MIAHISIGRFISKANRYLIFKKMLSIVTT